MTDGPQATGMVRQGAQGRRGPLKLTDGKVAVSKAWQLCASHRESFVSSEETPSFCSGTLGNSFQTV